MRNFQGYINRVNPSRGLDVKYGINFLNTCEKSGEFPLKISKINITTVFRA